MGLYGGHDCINNYIPMGEEKTHKQPRLHRFHLNIDIRIANHEVFLNYLQGSVEIIISGHNELTTHLIQLMPTHSSCTVCGVGSGADTHTELVVILVIEKNVSVLLDLSV